MLTSLSHHLVTCRFYSPAFRPTKAGKESRPNTDTPPARKGPIDSQTRPGNRTPYKLTEIRDCDSHQPTPWTVGHALFNHLIPNGCRSLDGDAEHMGNSCRPGGGWTEMGYHARVLLLTLGKSVETYLEESRVKIRDRTLGGYFRGPGCSLYFILSKTQLRPNRPRPLGDLIVAWWLIHHLQLCRCISARSLCREQSA